MVINYQEVGHEIQYVHHSVAVLDVNNKQPKVQNAAHDISRQDGTSK